MARIHTHIAHQRKDFLHKESRKIANSYDIVCMEDLNMKEISQDMCFGKSVHDNSRGMFTDFWHIKWNVPGRNGSVLTAGIPVPKPAAAVET